MRLHYLQHVPFEGPGNIAEWANDMGHSIEGTNIWLNDALPQLDDFDWLVIMGGPMNVYEDGKYPWLAAEKKLIGEAIAGGKIVFGVCLGAQLISVVLGGKVARNPDKEIGWYRTRLTDAGRRSRVFAVLPSEFTPMHWHGDMFSIPPGCANVAESEACANQALEYDGGRVIGLQFHLDYSPADIEAMLRDCSDELIFGKFIQRPEKIMAEAYRVEETKTLLYALLDEMASGQ